MFIRAMPEVSEIKHSGMEPCAVGSIVEVQVIYRHGLCYACYNIMLDLFVDVSRLDKLQRSQSSEYPSVGHESRRPGTGMSSERIWRRVPDNVPTRRTRRMDNSRETPWTINRG